MPDGLYERDALTWAETQADLLRRLAAGERVNEQIDWPNVIEEVQDVGLSELRACRNLLSQALRHILKLKAWPESTAARHWRQEATAFLVDARSEYTPSMRQRLDVSKVYQSALSVIRTFEDDTGVPATLPDACPFTLDDLLRADVPALVRQLAP